ncbi:MAG: Eco57I restriction-modification methylase domain-containing protein, partial [Sulfuricella sp.]
WRIFQRKLETLRPESPATTETRQQWITPLLGLLGYQLEYQAKGVELNGKTYAISHRVTNRGNTPIHIVGARETAGLDRKPESTHIGAPRMSAHALVQEYLNLHDELYGIVTNGRVLRLLRDSSRLIKLSYLEFDLDRIFSDGLFADFAILYRLLHVSRLPANSDAAAESLIERYHQDSLDSGARIREGLSKAVEQAIRDFANGFIAHPDNDGLRQSIADGKLKPETYYQYLLHLIYRLLFLLVIEERDLVFPPSASSQQRDIYRRYYSLERLRLLSEKRHLADKRHHDLWLALLATFRLFEAHGPGHKLGLAPLAGDLFSPAAIGPLASAMLGNDVLLGCLRALGLYQHPENNQTIRVNYAALNVEEFGSVYEGLLEYEPVFLNFSPRPQAGEGPGERVDAVHLTVRGELVEPPATQQEPFDILRANGILIKPTILGERAGSIEFAFAQGDQRAATGSHYTPDDLVQPLIKHSLDYLIADALKKPEPAKALLDLRVADISCGSGHILLAAARRIATELAIVRTGEEQPSPSAFRSAIRDVIRNCIYGVDLNPLAVELCKVALWLEAHSPGEPLNFLDHHIKCGNAIVGFARREEAERGVPDEAFATMPGDDKDTAALLRKRNKQERKDHEAGQLPLSPSLQKQLDDILRGWRDLATLPEHTPDEIESKKARYLAFSQSEDAWLLNQIAAIPIAQFYLPKAADNLQKFITDATYRRYWKGEMSPQGQATAEAWVMAERKRFFHWFLEFPEIMGRGGFDCILGNPPYLGGQGLSGSYGSAFCEYVKWEYAPAGLSDLVAYFVRRIYALLRPGGFTAFITTNSIKDGDIRKDGLEQVLAQGGAINMAVRGIKWPGLAKLVVSLVALHKGEWHGKRVLDGKEAPVISAYFEDSEDVGEPKNLPENANSVYQGSIFLGDGFLLTHAEADRLIEADPRNQEVVCRVINGDELNNQPLQTPQRSVINFQVWPESQASQYVEPFSIIEQRVKPERMKQKDKGGQEYWWRFLRPRNELYTAIRPLPRCFVAAATTKYLNFSAAPTSYVFLNTLYVFTTDRWDLYAVVQSTLHEVWARKYSGALKQDLRYSPSKCFDTFPFPEGLWQTASPALADLGERYHEYRRSLMRQLWLGLTDIYNLFHTRDLTPAQVAKVSKSPPAPLLQRGESEARGDFAEAGYQGILELRRLHRELDIAIRDAYGWNDLNLGHDFIEVETLPENDRVRYTLSPAARKEVLKRLLAENHRRAALEATAAAGQAPVKKTRAKKTKAAGVIGDLFDFDIAAPALPAIAAKPDQIDLSRLADLAWERPGTDQANEEAAVLAAILKAIGGPMPIRDIRLAALLAMRPRLLIPSLSADEATQWRRLIGAEAEPLAAGVAELQPPADHASGNAVRRLLALDRMIEDPAAQTWAPGAGLDVYTTEDHWPEWRVGMVLRILSQRGTEKVAETVPEALWELVNVRSA